MLCLSPRIHRGRAQNSRRPRVQTRQAGRSDTHRLTSPGRDNVHSTPPFDRYPLRALHEPCPLAREHAHSAAPRAARARHAYCSTRAQAHPTHLARWSSTLAPPRQPRLQRYVNNSTASTPPRTHRHQAHTNPARASTATSSTHNVEPGQVDYAGRARSRRERDGKCP